MSNIQLNPLSNIQLTSTLNPAREAATPSASAWPDSPERADCPRPAPSSIPPIPAPPPLPPGVGVLLAPSSASNAFAWLALSWSTRQARPWASSVEVRVAVRRACRGVWGADWSEGVGCVGWRW